MISNISTQATQCKRDVSVMYVGVLILTGYPNVNVNLDMLVKYSHWIW